MKPLVILIAFKLLAKIIFLDQINIMIHTLILNTEYCLL